MVFTWRHRGHVGVQNNREKVFWEFDSIIMQNTSHNLLLFCPPTWPSHHVTANHLLETSIFHISWNSCVEYVTRCCRGVYLAFFKRKEPSLKSVFKTSAILVSQDNETDTMLVTQTSLLFQYNSITLLTTWEERSYTVMRKYVRRWQCSWYWTWHYITRT